MIQGGQLGTHRLVQQRKFSVFVIVYLVLFYFVFFDKVKTRHSTKQTAIKAVLLTLKSFHYHVQNNKQDF